jgi:protocatechuate 3,4-dioxygenase beta subunit
MRYDERRPDAPGDHHRDRGDDHRDDHDRGLAFDVQTMVSRRRALTLVGLAGLGALVGCSSSDTADTSSSRPPGPGGPGGSGGPPDNGGGVQSVDGAIPNETAGPYPGDGSNGVNVLDDSGIVRGDITSSFGDMTGTAEGVPLTIRMTLTDLDGTPLEGVAVYVWHCDRDGRYSMYSDGVTDQNYLRGVQVADTRGLVTFTSIFPACYSGRWPHIHFEVYAGVADATTSGPIVATSQIALPEATCAAVYATGGYETSIDTLNQVSLATDNVFSDDEAVHQLATITGDVARGYTAELTVPVSA